VSTVPLETIRSDFDRIARLMADEPERAERYESFVLEQVPARSEKVLEVGCGAGRLARLIAGRGASVLGIDASPEMIHLARERSKGPSRLDLVCGDFLSHPFGPVAFDAVVSVATLHHLDAHAALARMKSLLRPGGVLVIHDLRAPAGFWDWVRSGLASIPNGDAVWWVRSGVRQNPAVRHAWHDHGSHDRYLTLRQVDGLVARELPGARIHPHPLWRYTVVWTRA
jgi:SAM-dependent methyltransferase